VLPVTLLRLLLILVAAPPAAYPTKQLPLRMIRQAQCLARRWSALRGPDCILADGVPGGIGKVAHVAGETSVDQRTDVARAATIRWRGW
jgi:hypothetical protein